MWSRKSSGPVLVAVLAALQRRADADDAVDMTWNWGFS
jgi:hypothetical protein